MEFTQREPEDNGGGIIKIHSTNPLMIGDYEIEITAIVGNLYEEVVTFQLAILLPMNNAPYF